MSERKSRAEGIRPLRIGPGKAICYSGYRDGQDPRRGIYPTYEQIAEDLAILAGGWRYLRLYDCSPHAETVLEVIERESMPFHVMLGIDNAAEVSNPNCPWGGEYDDETLAANREANERAVQQMIELANRYPEIVFAASIGNESSVDWNDHMVPVERLVEYARTIRPAIRQPVTFCENYVPWTDKLEPLAAELDFISVHTYPVWEYQTIDNALAYTQENYHAVAARYLDMPTIITEAGWTTASNGRGIEPSNASEALQASYYRQLMDWTTSENILTFVFEAFDEPWKGSDDPLEPEKHWGLFTVERKPKLVMQKAASRRRG